MCPASAESTFIQDGRDYLRKNTDGLENMRQEIFDLLYVITGLVKTGLRDLCLWNN